MAIVLPRYTIDFGLIWQSFLVFNSPGTWGPSEPEISSNVQIIQSVHV